MADELKTMKGMTDGLSAKLVARGIKNTDQYLAAASTPAGRKELAQATGADPKAILELANRADLARIKGVGGVFADLLEASGVDTVKELAGRVPANLHTKLTEVNAAKKLSSRTPKLEDVQQWVNEAKQLPKTLEY